MKDLTRVRRRKLLIGALSGYVVADTLPRKWVAPVVESVVLPAHAATSVIGQPGSGAVNLNAVLNGVTSGDIGTTFAVDAVNSVIPPGETPTYQFTAVGACQVESQVGPTAIIRRLLTAGTCDVSVVVSISTGSDSDSASAPVGGGPPGTP